MNVLVLGDDALAGVVTRALPGWESTVSNQALATLWTAGHQPFDAAIVDYSLAAPADRLVRNLRSVAPRTRVIFVCQPQEEPEARQALAAGADDYLIAPISPAELQIALKTVPLEPVAASSEPGPSPQEVVELGAILRELDVGPHETLRRLCALVRSAMRARSAAITLDDLTVHTGEDVAAVLLEPIHRNEVIVGGVAIGPAELGAWHTGTARRLSEYAALIDAIVAQSRERDRWRDLAWTDDVSRLRNRRYFDASLGRLLARSAAERAQLTVFLFDIDDFKSYNDRFGHETGDALIRELAALLRTCTREYDIIARYGGDEFAIVFWEGERPRVAGSRHPTDIASLTQRICVSVAAHDFECLGKGAPGPVTISGGVASFPWDGSTAAELMRAADRALLAAKRAGKNRIVLSDDPELPNAPS